MDILYCFKILRRKITLPQQQLSAVLLFICASSEALFNANLLHAQTAKLSVQQDWESTVAAAKKEGKVVVSIPASAELRKQLEDGFKKRFGYRGRSRYRTRQRRGAQDG